MQSVYAASAALMPGFPAFKTYAASPVWRDSAAGPVQFYRIAKRDAWALYRKLKAWNRTKVPGRYGGLVGSACLRVFECLVFDFLNFRNGRLDPSYEAIAAKTGLSRATVAAALKRLKELRVIHWVRRCSRSYDPQGGMRFEQETNAYAICGAGGWLGYDEPPAPVIHPSEWGAVPMMPDVIQQAANDARTGGIAAAIQTLRSDPDDPLAAALARLGASVKARQS